MRPDGKIYDVELNNFTSNVSYAVIRRKYKNKIIMKSYLIDLMSNTMTPMNYGKIKAISNSYVDGGAYMNSDRMGLRYYLNTTTDGRTKTISVEIQDSWEYVIRGVKKSNIKEKMKANVKANNENYTDKETEERNAKSVFNTGMAITIKKKSKIRNNYIITKQITVIGADDKSKTADLSKFETKLGDGEYIKLYIFPDEEQFFTNYDEAVNHMIENYENGKTGSFIENYLPITHTVHTWPDNKADQEMLMSLGYFPKTMNITFETN